MELSSLTIRVLLLFFPGLLCAMIVDALTVHRERPPLQFVTHAFSLGIASYLCLYALRGVCAWIAGWFGWTIVPIAFFRALLDENQGISWAEIALAGVVAVGLGWLVAAIINHKWVHRCARFLGVSRRSGELDVWSLLCNSRKTEWLIVRDLANDFTYFGWLEAFSDTHDHPELLLRKVRVSRSSTGAQLYKTELLYLARPSSTLVIEPVSADADQIAGAQGVGGEDHSIAGGDVLEGRAEHRAGQSAPEPGAGSAGHALHRDT